MRVRQRQAGKQRRIGRAGLRPVEHVAKRTGFAGTETSHAHSLFDEEAVRGQVQIAAAAGLGEKCLPTGLGFPQRGDPVGTDRLTIESLRSPQSRSPCRGAGRSAKFPRARCGKTEPQSLRAKTVSTVVRGDRRRRLQGVGNLGGRRVVIHIAHQQQFLPQLFASFLLHQLRDQLRHGDHGERALLDQIGPRHLARQGAEGQPAQGPVGRNEHDLRPVEFLFDRRPELLAEQPGRPRRLRPTCQRSCATSRSHR